jgi:hypothetical protein
VSEYGFMKIGYTRGKRVGRRKALTPAQLDHAVLLIERGGSVVLVSTNSALIGLVPVEAETAQIPSIWREKGFQFSEFLGFADLPLNHSGMAAFQKANEIQHLRAQIVWQGFGFLINQFSGVHLAAPLNIR